MKTELCWSLCCGILFSEIVSFGQGSFQNLNFEAADVVGFSLGALHVPVGMALPGWTAWTASRLETNQLSEVWYDNTSLGGEAEVSILDSSYLALRGNYSVALFTGGIGVRYSACISQTGLVPPGTESLQFDMYCALKSIVVSLNGQAINLVPLTSSPTYTVYGGDISQFAGQVAELKFTEPPTPPGQPQPSWAVLDDIVFSPSAIPEPSTLGLLWMGLPALLLSRRRDTPKRSIVIPRRSGWRRRPKSPRGGRNAGVMA